MKINLKYSKPQLYISNTKCIETSCLGGSRASEDEGICENGVDTSLVSSGNCNTGDYITDDNVCGVGAVTSGEAAYCTTGTSTPGQTNTCYAGGSAGISGNSCQAGGIVS